MPLASPLKKLLAVEVIARADAGRLVLVLRVDKVSDWEAAVGPDRLIVDVAPQPGGSASGQVMGLTLFAQGAEADAERRPLSSWFALPPATDVVLTHILPLQGWLDVYLVAWPEELGSWDPSGPVVPDAVRSVSFLAVATGPRTRWLKQLDEVLDALLAEDEAAA